MSLLTVVTVVKDDESGLRNTLTSLHSQDSRDFTILVLDGSTDRNSVPSILATFPDLLTVYRWAEPSGVYGAMNQALNDVVTPYTYFLNAGDELASTDVLARAHEALLPTMPTWAFGRVLFFSETGAPLNESPWSYPSERKRLFARGFFPAHQGVIVATEELRRQGGFDLDYLVAADYASILKCSITSDPLELGFALAVFRQGGLSTTQWRRSLQEFHRARRSIFRPAGKAALLEQCDTWRVQLKTHAYHAITALRIPRRRKDSTNTKG